MNTLPWLAHFFSSLGALNWGLVTFFKLNIVEYICNKMQINYLKEALYAIIGVSGLYALLSLFA